ncbi:MAG: protein translocase subunit SecF [Kofleriaceae bacterium]
MSETKHKFRYMLPPGTNFQFVPKFKAWIWLSVVLTIATIAILFVNKSVRGDYMNWTIDFKGGTELVMAFQQNDAPVRVDAAAVRKAFEAAGEHALEIGEMHFTDGDTSVDGMIVKTSKVLRGDALGKQYEQILEEALPGTDVRIVQSASVGAKAGDKLRDDAIKSLIYAIALIMLYLAFRFDIRYAPGAAFAVIHDAVMVIGVFALTWTEVSLTTVAALLTVMGYSVNETVISFDRIRENEQKLKEMSLERIIDISINERLTRTIMTASTVFATTLIMNIFGAGLVKNFAFAMNIGVIVATYSSIFLAAPIFLWISKKWYSGPPRRGRGAPPPAAQE